MVKMDGMTAMEMEMAMAKEEAPFLSMGVGELSKEEFMVVPSIVEDQFSATQLDEFLLESNFAGLTGTILSPPNVDLHQFCTIDGDGGRQSEQGFVFDQSRNQEIFLQQGQPFNFESDFSATTTFGGGQYFDDNFDFDGGQQVSEPVQEETVLFDSVWQNGQEGNAVQLSELEDPEATWLAEPADLDFIEQMASENDQHCQLLDELDELFRDDQSFQDTEPSSDDTEVSMASVILNEIYREAQQIEIVAPVVPDRPVRVQQSMKSSASPHFHLADHDFGSARRGRPPGSTKRRGVLKRDLKSKKQHQNREAALRYRLKKKSEKLEKDGELGQLEKRNLFLKTEVHTLTAELKYMKELFIEFRKAKGV